MPRTILVASALMLTASLIRGDVATEKWPNRVRVFPAQLPATISYEGFQITLVTPAEPDVRAAGGSGGPMLEVRVLNARTGETRTFYTQSVCAVLLEPWHGHPQFEIWGRGGGGYWTRGLYRFVSAEYRPVRYDEFEEAPRHNNENAPTVRPPFAPHGEADEQGKLLYFVETRIPNS
jgi:hypothetical protein